MKDTTCWAVDAPRILMRFIDLHQLVLSWYSLLVELTHGLLPPEILHTSDLSISVSKRRH